MVYDDGLAQRIREVLEEQYEDSLTEKKMFGGLAFFIRGNMCCSVAKERLIVQVGKDNYEESLQQDYVQKTDIIGRAMRGMIYVEEEGIQEDEILEYWVLKGAAFAKSLLPK